MNSVINTRAVIDVGTNSVKLLVAEVSERGILPRWEESQQTRLGQGFYEARQLQRGPIVATARAVKNFVAAARQRGAESIRVIATSAARDAVNAWELTEAIQADAGMPLEIISGDQEADWVYQGVAADRAFLGKPLLVMDVGGGSTEFIFGTPESSRSCRSFPVGSVRLLEASPPSDPPQLSEKLRCQEIVRGLLRDQVRPWLWPSLQIARAEAGPALAFAATGGTASLLGRMEAELETFDRALIEATSLSRERLQWHMERLWSLPLVERKNVVGLPPNRADVILMGTLIFSEVMRELELNEMRISTRGLRFAALLDPIHSGQSTADEGQRA